MEPILSIIIPCLQEERFIGDCLESLLSNGFPEKQMEILVVDGMSTDRTREIVQHCSRQHPCIKLLNNPSGKTPTALNIGIQNAKGKLILRIDAHSSLEGDYIAQCIYSLEKYGADQVGGLMKVIPRTNNLLGKAIAFSLSHRFGVGNSYFRIHTEVPKWVDTVFGACSKRDIFDRVGQFNEHLYRGQDIEYSLRLKNAGGRTLLIPNVASHYYARSDMKSFLKHNWDNGLWAILPFTYSDVMPVSWRHLVPLTFVSVLIGAIFLSLISPLGLWLLIGVGGMYLAANVVASTQVVIREKDIRYLPVLSLVFMSLHLSYGAGSFWGLSKTAIHKLATFLHFRKKYLKPC